MSVGGSEGMHALEINVNKKVGFVHDIDLGLKKTTGIKAVRTTCTKLVIKQLSINTTLTH